MEISLAVVVVVVVKVVCNKAVLSVHTKSIQIAFACPHENAERMEIRWYGHELYMMYNMYDSLIQWLLVFQCFF